MRRKLLSCLLVVSMVLSLITALPITANAEDNNCLIVETNNEYATLQDALAARTDGQTIKLLSDITHNSAIQVDSAALDLKIDLNGKTLTVNASGSCISAYNNVEIEVIDSVEGGRLVANTTSEGSIALRAESYGTITVDAPLTINATSNGSWGIRTYAAGSVIVTDAEINATRMGVESYGDWNNHTDPSQIIVTGNITTSAEEEDCGAYAYSGGKVYVTGDVVSSSIGVYSEGGTISVTGNVTGNSVGAQAYDGGAINVTGNVTANGDLGCGATVITSSSVQIDGVINAPVYVNIGGDNLTAANTYEPTRLVGYYTYANASDPSNYVLVKGIYSVTFDTQGGSTIGSVTTDYDTTITQPSAPTRTGYTFGGWYKESACTDDWDFTTDKVTSDTTLYAKWAPNTYTVKFNTNGGKGTMPSLSLAYNTSKTLTANAFKKTGYSFLGWAKTPTGAVVYKEKTSVKNLTAANRGTVNLYAKWGPPILEAKSQNYTSIKISWAYAGSATSYKVYRATRAKGTYSLVHKATSTARSWIDRGQKTGKTYYYKVYPVAGGKTYKFSTYKSAKAVPTAPTVKAFKYTTSSAKITWTGVAGATKYKIYRATSSTGTYSLVYTASSKARSWVNTGRTVGKTYYYKVRAYHLEGKTKVYGSYSSPRYVRF